MNAVGRFWGGFKECAIARGGSQVLPKGNCRMSRSPEFSGEAGNWGLHFGIGFCRTGNLDVRATV